MLFLANCWLVASCLCSAFLLHAQTSAPPSGSSAVDPQKLALIRQIVLPSETDQLRKRLSNVLIPQRLASMRRNPIYPPGYVDELEKKLTEQVNAIDPSEIIAPVYAEHFSVDELQQILAFRTSPVGQKLWSAQFEMNSEIVKRASLQALQLSSSIEKEIDAEHPDWAQQIQNNRSKLGPASNADNGGEPVLRIGGDVSAPAIVTKIEPQYTPEALQTKLEGSVLLSIVVGQDGVPREIRVLRSLGSGLDQKAVEAVSQWRFRPGMKAGLPVAVRAQIEVNFRLLQNPRNPKQ